MVQKRMTTCESEEQPKKKVQYQVECVTYFNDLPDEIILMICQYLSPAHVVEAFLNCGKRLFSCMSEYHQKIDLTNCSAADFDYFLVSFRKKCLHPSTLTVSNARLPSQIRIFSDRFPSSKDYQPDSVLHLSLLECTNENLYDITKKLEKFKSLETLNITQSTPKKVEWPATYPISEDLCYLIFYSSFSMLTKLQLTIDDGIILSKQLSPNKHLKHLTVFLQNINDLYVLLAGLVPNLIVLNVTLCQSDTDKRLSLPRSWPLQSMSHLIEFQLVTNENVEFTFDQLHNIVMPLIQLNKLTLYIRQWISNNQQFVQGNQFQMLIDRFMPQLQHFYCFIKTLDDIDMQTFATLSERWPMKSCLKSDNLHKHLYTVPWSFKQLDISMLANDDTASVCPNVQYLTLDVFSINLSYRFPNIHTLTIPPECNFSHNDFIGFRRLRHLTMNNINVVPCSAIRRIHTMTLFDINDLSTHSNIYSNVRNFILKSNQNNSLATIKALIQHFPNLRSLQIQLQLERNTEYYNTLDILLDVEHLPHLLLLKTNWIDDETYSSNVTQWLASKTSLKWRSTVNVAYHCGNYLIICL